MKRIPTVGEEIDFYDDGKTSESRHYKGVVCYVLPFEEGKDIDNLFIDTFDNKEPDKLISRKSHTLQEIWRMNKEDCDWLFAEETDHFIGVAIPKYDEHIIWFAREKYGKWYSMNIQSFWQGGILDVDGEITKRIKEERENFNRYEAIKTENL